MAATDYGVNSPEAVKLWSKALAREALKKTYVGRFIGQGPDSLLQEKTETKKDAGDRVTSTLLMQLNGDGVTEGQVLEGNEESLTTYTDNLFINELANAVRSKSKISRQRVPWNVRENAKSMLSDWFAGRVDQIFFNHVCGYTPETRAVYNGNNDISAPDSNHIVRPTGMTTDQGTNGDSTKIFTLDLIDKAVNQAEILSPMIRPLKINGEDKYVMFLHSNQARDLRTNTATGQWLDIQKSALAGGAASKSPIYTGALGEYNGVILHKSPRVTNGVHSTSGAAQTSVRRAVLCGAQAAVIAFGKGQGFEQWEWVEDEFDYEREYGVSAQTIMGLKKSRFNSSDFGTIVVPTYAANPV
jgi:N4-gp56 family major capsid protein